MTREEEIRQEARKYFDDYMDGLKGEVLTVQQTFEDGAKWADENLNSNGKELLYVAQKTAERTKKEVISRACEWLKLNTNWDDEWDEMGRNIDYGMIEEFRKAMEE